MWFRICVDQLSRGQRQLVQRAGVLGAVLSDIETHWVRGEPIDAPPTGRHRSRIVSSTQPLLPMSPGRGSSSLQVSQVVAVGPERRLSSLLLGPLFSPAALVVEPGGAVGTT